MVSIEEEGVRYVATKEEIEKIFLFPIKAQMAFYDLSLNIGLELSYDEDNDMIILTGTINNNVFLSLVGAKDVFKVSVEVDKKDFKNWFSDPSVWYQDSEAYQKTKQSLLERLRLLGESRKFMFASFDNIPEFTEKTDGALGILYYNRIPMAYVYINRIDFVRGVIMIDKNMAYAKDLTSYEFQLDIEKTMVIQSPYGKSILCRVQEDVSTDSRWTFTGKFQSFYNNPFPNMPDDKDSCLKLLEKAYVEDMEASSKDNFDVLSKHTDFSQLF